MGELHLDIYVERMKREYGVECVTGKPRVAFRESVTSKAPFNYRHKKQTGGAGQFAVVEGFVEPIEPEDESSMDNIFDQRIVGNQIPHAFFPGIDKGFKEACDRGRLTGHPVVRCRFVLTDGQAHSVDSSELAFRLATIGAFREAFEKSRPVILEPVMSVEVIAPTEFQGNVIGAITGRKGTIIDTEIRDDDFTLFAEVALNDMFGYSSQLRGLTQGKGEFTMEYKRHMPVLPNVQKEMEESYRKKQLGK